MATWSPLRDRLASVRDRMTFAWSELDDLVGGLPASAYNHPAFWAGERSGWPGFATVDVRVGRSVTFVRRTAAAAMPRTAATTAASPALATDVDVVLVGCGKRKLDHPAPARDPYTSPLFAMSRAYAERHGARWFVLSAKHGLVEPSEVVEPYDLTLSATSVGYRRAWGGRVVDDLAATLGPLDGVRIEVLAGARYTDALRAPLVEEGASVAEPLAGLPLGSRLRWLRDETRSAADVRGAAGVDVDEIIGALQGGWPAMAPAEYLATGGAGQRLPGLYSWWVDAEGARELERGLGHSLRPGLIYAGLAGATRSRSGRRSSNTLWGRITTMHLGGRHEFSTFRLSLGSALAAARAEAEIDEGALTRWMHAHLRVITVPVADPDGLDALEDAVLERMDPPLNLSKVPRTPLRARLTELRRIYSRKRRRA